MIDEAEMAARAGQWFAGQRVPAGTRLVLRPDRTRRAAAAHMFFAGLQPEPGHRGPASGPPFAAGNCPVVVDRRNGAVTPLGTGGHPDRLFEAYLDRYADEPPPVQPLPGPAGEPSPPLRSRRRGRPGRSSRPGSGGPDGVI